MTEQPLDGGITNAGSVRRDGLEVVRPSTHHSASIHAFLGAVRQAGFDGVPQPVGIDADGDERLEFIEGDVALAPYPAWSQSDDALASAAQLVRRLHEAGEGFDARAHRWNDALADPVGGSTVCHNDLELSNIVFRDGRATALIDFEFAAPGRPGYDLAHLARLCVPIEDDVDRRRMGWRAADRPARLRLMADAYGLDRPGRCELVSAIPDALDRIEAFARRQARAAGSAEAAALVRTGGLAKYDRRRRWWRDHRHAIESALR